MTSADGAEAGAGRTSEEETRLSVSEPIDDDKATSWSGRGRPGLNRNLRSELEQEAPQNSRLGELMTRQDPRIFFRWGCPTVDLFKNICGII